MTQSPKDPPLLQMLLRCAAVGVLLAVALLYWPLGAAEPPAEGVTPLVQIYTTKSCGYCKLLRRYLSARGIPYADYDIETNRDARLAFDAAGAQGVPLVVIGGQRIQGFNPVAIEKALDTAEPPGAVSEGPARG
jgi:glutaredoxin